jgi:hypothetical protein
MSPRHLLSLHRLDCPLFGRNNGNQWSLSATVDRVGAVLVFDRPQRAPAAPLSANNNNGTRETGSSAKNPVTRPDEVGRQNGPMQMRAEGGLYGRPFNRRPVHRP